MKSLKINNNAIVTIGSTIGSLAGYSVGKAAGKDGVPQMLIGGAVGTLIVMLLINEK